VLYTSAINLGLHVPPLRSSVVCMLIVDFGSTETTSLTQYDRVIDVSQCTTVPSYDAMRSATD